MSFEEQARAYAVDGFAARLAQLRDLDSDDNETS